MTEYKEIGISNLFENNFLSNDNLNEENIKNLDKEYILLHTESRYIDSSHDVPLSWTIDGYKHNDKIVLNIVKKDTEYTTEVCIPYIGLGFKKQKYIKLLIYICSSNYCRNIYCNFYLVKKYIKDIDINTINNFKYRILNDLFLKNIEIQKTTWNDNIWNTFISNYDTNNINKLSKISDKCTFYDFQLNNIYNMLEKENPKKKYKIDITLSLYLKSKNNEYISKSGNLNKEIILDNKNIYGYYNVLNSDVIKEKCLLKYSCKGGILSDEMGLGKTRTSLGLINYDKLYSKNINSQIKFNKIDVINEELSELSYNLDVKTNSTLIICPSHMINHWIEESNKINDGLKIIKILTKRDHQKISYENILEADIVFISYQFLLNTKYYFSLYFINNCTPSRLNLKDRQEIFKNKLFIKDNPIAEIDVNSTQILFEYIHWNRIMLDEPHELFDPISLQNTKITEWIIDLKSNNKWYITGTPFCNYKIYFNCLKFLGIKSENINFDSLIKNLFFKYQYQQLIQNLLIRNTKDSLENQIQIPNHVQELIWLKMTDDERTIYNTNLKTIGNVILRQLCCHPLVSDNYQNIINKETNMDLVIEKLIDYHNDRIEKYEKKVLTLNTGNPEYSMIKANYEKIVKDSKYLFKTFSKLKVKDQEQDQDQDQEENTNSPIQSEYCSICLDDIKELAVTNCGHEFCKPCIEILLNNKYNNSKCPICRNVIEKYYTNKEKKEDSSSDKDSIPYLIKNYGTKVGSLIALIRKITLENKKNRIIIFSEWDILLNMIGKILADNYIPNSFIKGNVYHRNKAINRFKSFNDESHVIMLSLDKAASGTNLIEATHIIMMEPIDDTKEKIKAQESQAIARAVRLGQTKQIKLIRLLIENSIEENIWKEKYLTNTI